MFNIEQFLDLTNYVTDSSVASQKPDKKSGIKKFDICLMNPPYSQRHNNNPTHFQFVEKVLEIVEKQIVIMPSRILHTTSENYNPWKEKFDKTLLSAEELKSDVFEGTCMMDVAIYELSNNKNADNIKIKTLSSCKWEEKSSLFDSTIHNTYEDGILKLLDNNGNIKLFNLKTGTSKKNINYVNDDRKKVANKTLPKYKDKYLLSVNIANGGMNGHYMSSYAGKIFYNDIEKVLNDWINRNVNAIKYIVFNSKLAAENCRDAMKRPLLRFALYRTQDDQSMNNKCYKYIADIDWENKKVKTDEGILELCDCPKDKCKEYAEYCKKIIDEVDKGNRP